MSYFIRLKKTSTGQIYWHLKRDEWKDGKKKTVHIPEDQLLQHGFQPDMSIEDAKTRAHQLNKQNKIEKDADRKKVAALRSMKDRELIQSAHLPMPFMEEFVTGYLKEEMMIGPNGAQKYRKALCEWEYVKRMVAAVGLPQNLWFQHKRRFFSYISKEATAPDYATKILRVLNLWGVFMAIKTGGSFIPVPSPKGNDREMIAEAYIADESVRKKTSEPITPEMLENARSNLKDSQYRWLYLSVWLGLRPPEVDAITMAKIKKEQGVPVLWVYQSKLKGVKKEDRYKPIPILYREQKRCLDFIKKEIQRPLVKTVQKHVLEGANLYGGRKGFTDLMLGKGQSLEDISTWLGHATIERTWQSYKQRQKVSFKKVS